MPAQKRLHMQSHKPTFSKSHTLFSNLMLAPCLHQKKNEPENNFIPRCFERTTFRRVRQVTAIKESGKGFWLNLPTSREHISQAASEQPCSSAQCKWPAAHVQRRSSWLAYSICRFVSIVVLNPSPKKEEKNSDSSSQMQISPKEPSYV